MENTAIADDLSVTIDDFLSHHGIRGQKWYNRRYQNEDGSLTPLGRIHYGVGEAKNRLSNFDGTSYARASLGKLASKSSTAADALDTLNRKGVLDFLDAHRDTKFSAIAEYKPKFDVNKEIIDNYRSDAYKDVDEAYRKTRRYASMVAGMRKNEPFVKVEDTSKPWMETFKNGMMGWNHTPELEKIIGSKAGVKLTDFIESDQYKGHKIEDVLKYDRPELVGKIVTSNYGFYPRESNVPLSRIDLDSMIDKATKKFMRNYSEDTGLGGFNWDKPMTIQTVDGLKVNAVVYDNGGGVSERLSAGSKQYLADQANEVRRIMNETGRLPLSEISQPYYSTRQTPNFIDEFDREMYDWVVKHYSIDDASDFLSHHGTKGMKWYNRRYQNEDGSLTPLGRIHYGVGEARGKISKAAGSVKSGASKAGKAVKKAVLPSDEEKIEKLNKKIEKEKNKQTLEAKRIELDELRGKKQIKDMSDQEVIDMINRHRNDRILKSLAEDASKSRVRLMIEEKARDGLSRAIGKTVEGIVGNVGQHLVDSTSTEEDKLKRAVFIAESKKKLKDLSSNPNGTSKKLKEEADDAKNAHDAYLNSLKVQAMQGDERAKKIISDMANINKGKYESPKDKNQEFQDRLDLLNKNRQTLDEHKALPSPNQNEKKKDTEESKDTEDTKKSKKSGSGWRFFRKR